MNMLKGLIGGLIAGLIGGALWAAIAVSTGYEIGWIAWGIGGLVGFGVACGGQAGLPAGLAAVIISLVAILGGKYATVDLLVSKELGDAEQMIEQAVERLEDDEFVTSWLADDIIEERVAQGDEITWPPGVTPDDVDEEADYPPEIWAVAADQWDGKAPGERDAYRGLVADVIRENIEENFDAYRAEIMAEGFLASFGPLDIVFVVLAMVTAFKIGRGDEEGQAVDQGVNDGETSYEHDPEAEMGAVGEVEAKP